MIKELEILAETAKEFVQNIISPPLIEVGGLFADQIKLYRFKNQINIVIKAQEVLNKSGLKTKKVALNVLAPLLEDCSLVEDESLQEMWANLLANTAKEDSTISNTLFVHILSQINNSEASILDQMATYSLNRIPHEQRTALNTTLFPYKQFDEQRTHMVYIDNLLRLRILTEAYGRKSTMPALEVSELGYAFYEACQPPK